MCVCVCVCVCVWEGGGKGGERGVNLKPACLHSPLSIEFIHKHGLLKLM